MAWSSILEEQYAVPESNLSGILGIVRIMHSLFLKYFLKLEYNSSQIEIIAILNASLFLKSSKFSSLSCCGLHAKTEKLYFV